MVVLGGGVGKKIAVGVCVMEKKVKCGSEVQFLLLNLHTIQKTEQMWKLKRIDFILFYFF